MEKMWSNNYLYLPRLREYYLVNVKREILMKNQNPKRCFKLSPVLKGLIIFTFIYRYIIHR